MVDIALEVMRAVTVAVRPLTLYELAVMADLPADARQSEEIARQYAEQCGSLLTIGNNYVYFVHQSAK